MNPKRDIPPAQWVITLIIITGTVIYLYILTKHSLAELRK